MFVKTKSSDDMIVIRRFVDKNMPCIDEDVFFVSMGGNQYGLLF